MVNPYALPPLLRPPSGNLSLSPPVFASALLLLLLPRNVDSSLSRHFRASPSASELSDSMNRSQVLEYVMKRCKNCGFARAGDALHYFKVMIRLNPLPSPPCFVQLLGAAARMKHYAATIHMIERMDSMGISRNACVLNILINCLCHLKRSDLGFSVLTKMFKLGLEPDVVTLTTLLNGLCEEDKTSQALTLVEEMQGKEFMANVFTYCVIVKGLCRAGNTSNAVRLIRNLEERGCELNVVTYTTMIDGYCKEGLVAEALGF
ncbi:pentatricopeptide repeat-containing protein At5g16640, mitochondrial, partial [Rhodamnia argentea]|uniref:Pentatricopeptide repeat-containing protein At5g16640, mitochondrial n=1 Tax=Rhodamnia argentea TaxID=178133 RepID=A0ABM3HC16_9MYRT